MVEIFKHAQLQKLGSLTFCYLCGEDLPPNGDPGRNRDHVPPTKIFKPEDRGNPLILPTHTSCNHGESSLDEQIVHLIGILHGRAFDPRELRLKIAEIEDPRGKVGLVYIEFERLIWRWVRAFYTALYREYLPLDTPRHIQPPMTPGRPSRDGLESAPVLQQQYDYVEIIERNRALGKLDRVVTRAGKCIYECVWVEVEGVPERHACIFALRIYDWSSLGVTDRTGRRGCTGSYGLTHLPSGAPVEVPDPERIVTGSLDPFPE